MANSTSSLRKVIVFGMGLAAFSFCAAAESPKVPAPPFIAAPPEMGSWTIVIESFHAGTTKKADPKASGELASACKEIQCVKTGKLKRETFVTQSGEHEDHWYSGSYSITHYENSDQYVAMDTTVTNAENVTKAGSITGPGFPGFGWLSAENYRKQVEFQSKQCHYFQMTIAAPMGESKDSALATPRELEAWIEVGTNLPVAIKTGGVLFRYEFHEAPTEMLQLPPACAAALQQVESRESRLKALREMR